MNSPLVTRSLSKRYRAATALNSVDLEIPAGRVVGLVGQNGAGKSTLLNIACGRSVPTSGTCVTLGQDASKLDPAHLERVGYVPQGDAFLVDHLRVSQHLQLTATFYPKWDLNRQEQMCDALEVPVGRKLNELSPGDRQKLAIILGTCHRPELLLLDEPMGALDPIVRGRMLGLVMDFVREDGCTVVVSSHILSDLEKIVDWIVCLVGGEVAANGALDYLQESYAEWVIASREGVLPVVFPESYVISRTGDNRHAKLYIRTGEASEEEFSARHGVDLVARPMTLEQIFPAVVDEWRHRR